MYSVSLEEMKRAQTSSDKFVVCIAFTTTCLGASIGAFVAKEGLVGWVCIGVAALFGFLALWERQTNGSWIKTITGQSADTAESDGSGG